MHDQRADGGGSPPLQQPISFRENHAVDDVDDAVFADEIGFHDLGSIDHHGTVLDLDGRFLAVDGRDLAGFHIGGHDFAGDDVVGENAGELLLVLGLEKRLDGALGQLREGLVGGGEDGEGTIAREGLDETGRLHRSDEGGEILGSSGDFDDRFGGGFGAERGGRESGDKGERGKGEETAFFHIKRRLVGFAGTTPTRVELACPLVTGALPGWSLFSSTFIRQYLNNYLNRFSR